MITLQVLASIASSSVGGNAPAAPHQYVPTLQPPSHLFVACLYDAPEQIALNGNESVAKAEVVMLESLAGLLLRHGSPGGVGLYLESNVDGRLLLQQIQKRRGVTVTYANRSTTPFALAQQLAAAANITSFVRFDAATNPQSTNVARMAVSMHNALMVDRHAVGAAVAAGFSLAEDVSDKDDGWVLQHLLPAWPYSKAMAVEQSNTLASDDFACVNDIAPAFGALAFGDVGSGNRPGAHRDEFLSAMSSQGLVIGWPSYNEVDSVSTPPKSLSFCELSYAVELAHSRPKVARYYE